MIKIKAKEHDKFKRMKEAREVLNNVSGCSFTEQKNPYHWIVSYNDEEIHYWPTTGKWYIPAKNLKCEYRTRFLAGLLTYIGVEFIHA